MAEKEGFFRTWRGDRLRWLIHEKPDALRLLLLIQDRARYNDDWNPLNLEKRQAVLGFSDVSAWKWTERRYRTAKNDLLKAGACDFQGDRRGTIVTLSDNVAYVSDPPKNDGQSDGQSDGQATDERRTPDGPPTDGRRLTKKLRSKEGEEGEEESPCSPPPGDGPPLALAGDESKPRAKRRSAWTRKQLEAEAYEAYPGFRAWWAAYPNGAGKRKAFEAWVKLGLEFLDPEPLFKVLTLQKKTPQWQEEGGKFVPHGSTYLNQRMFEDDVLEKKDAATSKVDFSGKFEE